MNNKSFKVSGVFTPGAFLFCKENITMQRPGHEDYIKNCRKLPKKNIENKQE
jgi:hypothetical protein